MAAIEDVRTLSSELERSYEVYVRGRLKFRVGQIVYVAFSLDKTVMGFAFPREERAALVASDPHRFHLPPPADMRFNWVHAAPGALERTVTPQRYQSSTRVPTNVNHGEASPTGTSTSNQTRPW
jgi:hypothetical protein